MAEKPTPPPSGARVVVFNATVSAQNATPEQIEQQKLKEQSSGPRNSSPL